MATSEINLDFMIFWALISQSVFSSLSLQVRMGLWCKILMSNDLRFRLYYLIGNRPKIASHWASKDCVRGPFITCKLRLETTAFFLDRLKTGHLRKMQEVWEKTNAKAGPKNHKVQFKDFRAIIIWVDNRNILVKIDPLTTVKKFSKKEKCLSCAWKSVVLSK